MGMSKEIVIGYKYYMDLQMGLGRGPIDELVEIKVADLSAWKGSVTSTGSIRINKPNLFGGEKKEGGIDGTLYVYMGESTQVMPDWIKTLMGGIVPGFRNVCTLWFTGMIAAMNPYPKTWKFRVRRSAKGWQGGTAWEPGLVTINMTADDGSVVKAMNPIHMIYEGLTNSAWGRGLDVALIDQTSFRNAAAAMYIEQFGLNMAWNRKDTIDSFIQSVIDHIGAAMYLHPRTGQITIRLIRADYDVNNPAHYKEFTYSTGLLAVEDYTVAGTDTTTNSVAITYTDPVTGNKLTTAPVDNLAAIQMTGSVNRQTTEYFGICNGSLAARLALRDLAANMGSLFKCTLHVNRRGWDVLPGSIVCATIPEYDVERMFFRVGSVSHSTLIEGAIAITVAQDVFSLPATSYVQQQPGGWTPPDYTARPAVFRRVRELSYRDTYRAYDPANFELIGKTDALIYGMAAKPEGMGYSFDMYDRTGSADFTEQATSDFTPNAVIGNPIPVGWGVVSVNLTNTQLLDEVVVGDPAVIDDEEFIVQSLNLTTLVCTLARGTLDTLPAAHASGARIWFYNDSTAEDYRPLVAGQTANVKMLTRTSQQLLDLSAAPTDNFVTFGRQGRPFPPGNLKINNMAMGDMLPFVRPAVFTWANRNKEVQQDQLYPHTFGNFALPDGTTHTIRILKVDGTVLRTVPGVTGTTWTYDATMIGADGIDDLGGSFRFQLWTVDADSTRSWQMYDVTLVVVRPGLGYSLGYLLGGS